MKDSVTIDTLKVVNIIFSEHEFFQKENTLLKNKIELLQDAKNILESKDSLRVEQINTLEKKHKSEKKNWIKGSSIGCVITFILGLLI